MQTGRILLAKVRRRHFAVPTGIANFHLEIVRQRPHLSLIVDLRASYSPVYGSRIRPPLCESGRAACKTAQSRSECRYRNDMPSPEWLSRQRSRGSQSTRSARSPAPRRADKAQSRSREVAKIAGFAREAPKRASASRTPKRCTTLLGMRNQGSVHMRPHRRLSNLDVQRANGTITSLRRMNQSVQGGLY